MEKPINMNYGRGLSTTYVLLLVHEGVDVYVCNMYIVPLDY